MAEYPVDQIFVPTGPVKEIADAGNTPFFLYDEQGIEDSIQSLHSAFSWAPDYQNYFPLRENINPHILSILQHTGTGVCVCSRAELQLALTCGFSGSQILYEPSRCDSEAETLAINAGASWLCDSVDLLPDQLPSRLILRYNPIDLPLSPPQKQTIMRSKNGFNKAQILNSAAQLHLRGADKLGLALQISAYNIHSGFWSRKASILFGLAKEIEEKTGVVIGCCHIGEGPGLPYQPRVVAPELKTETELIHSLYDQLPPDRRPILCSGVCSRLMEPHGLLITKILEERSIYRTFLILDAGVCQFSRPLWKQAYRHVSVLGKSQIENRKLYSLVGDLPDSFDRLVQKGRMLPKVVPGEYCVFHDVGCGARSMPTLYGLRPVAAEYLYRSDGSIEKIAPGHSEEEVLQFLTAL